MCGERWHTSIIIHENSKALTILGGSPKDTNASSSDISSDCTTEAAVSSVVCSLTFGVLLGAVGVYLTLRMRGRSSNHTSTAVILYEGVGVATGVKKSQGLLMRHMDNISLVHYLFVLSLHLYMLIKWL